MDIRKRKQGSQGTVGLVSGLLAPDVFTPSFGALGPIATLQGYLPAIGLAGL